MVSVTSEKQFYTVAQFAVPGSYVGDMYDIYEDNSVVIVDIDRWFYANFEKSLDLKEEYGYPISFEEFEMRYLETVPTDKVMTHDDEVKTMKDNIIHANIGSKKREKYMEELNKEDEIAGESTNSQDEVKVLRESLKEYGKSIKETEETGYIVEVSTREEFQSVIDYVGVDTDLNLFGDIEGEDVYLYVKNNRWTYSDKNYYNEHHNDIEYENYSEYSFNDFSMYLSNDSQVHKQDMINHPIHYKQFSREVIDTMQGMSTAEEFKGYLKLNAVKYLSRYQGKNGVEDLDKAIWYVTKLKEVLEGEQ